MDKTRRAIEDVMGDPRLYVRLLEKLFMMKDARGNKFPYKSHPIQADWHKMSFVAQPRLNINRIWTKCRGVGATVTTMMDHIMTGIVYDDIEIPISSVSAERAKRGPIKWGNYLIDNPANPDFKFARDEAVNSEIRLLDTKSIIHLVPATNSKAIRGIRSPAWFADEFDWLDGQSELLDAGENCISEGGQISIVSTIQNRTGEFQKILDNAEDLNFWVHNTPLFDKKEFNRLKPIQEQIDAGLKPIVPWLNVKRLQAQLNRNWQVFMRENMCKAPDESVNFMSWDLITKICSLTWEGDPDKKWGVAKVFDEEGRPFDFHYLGRPPGNLNPFIIGWDFARFKDLFVAQVWEHTEFGCILRYEQVGRGSDTPSQNALLDRLMYAFKMNEARIDMTGPGIGFYDYAYKKHGSKCIGVSFSRTMEIDGDDFDDEKDDGTIRIPIKDALALHFRRESQIGRVFSFDYREEKDDYNVVPYDLANIPKTREGSHGDRFWASALGVYPSTYNSPFAFFG